ncbi:phosphonoacetate hydrolase [Arthrobacter livingstonensis]|uniref:Phosphonoacetate hydrolase n=1 Tax=Arthrobacter livingstonensis TaxID=670078 RepID=A0A2V5LSV8_9MICC|nr:zinc ribbon domain-containing protein YjdM [Arthrobacter livingstonensis]PYI66177.1 phosphonoacetate hydrolase [Arthrobacter livingstonensis]
MSETLPACPECASPHGYAMGELLVCPECGHEWSPTEQTGEAEEPDGARSAVKDAVGNILADGDTVSITRTMKVKGSPQGLKAGTKVRNIRLVPPVDGHDIDARIDGFGPMKLKSSVVKKI